MAVGLIGVATVPVTSHVAMAIRRDFETVPIRNLKMAEITV